MMMLSCEVIETFLLAQYIENACFVVCGIRKLNKVSFIDVLSIFKLIKRFLNINIYKYSIFTIKEINIHEIR
jgi:hypothetical protein